MVTLKGVDLTVIVYQIGPAVVQSMIQNTGSPEDVFSVRHFDSQDDINAEIERLVSAYTFVGFEPVEES